ncbi:MAG: tetratricopeptide repeat protein, partial [Desulfobacterales bacterium]|nr:tetratricopeptide repeat protein [Desulfobacterales bacterium]
MTKLKNIITFAILLFFATGSYYLYRMFMGDYYITQAKEIEKGKDWNTAVRAYRKAIEYAPRNPEYRLLCGKFYLRFAKAANDGKLKETLFKRAWCELEEAKKTSPKDARTYTALARVSEAMLPPSPNTKNPSAEQYYLTAVSLYPNSTQYRYLLARYYKKAGKTGEALQQVETMITLDPRTDGYVRRNRFWQMPGIDEAVENGLRQALKNSFTRNDAAGVLASRLDEKQRWAEAASVYEQAMPKGAFADRTGYYLRMGRYLLHGGKEKEAEAYFLRGVAGAPDRAAVIKRFIGDYERDGKLEEIFALFEKLKRLYPEMVETDLYHAQVLCRHKKYRQALSHLEGFLKRKETAEADYWMAMTCEKLREPYRAETYIKRAIKWEPEKDLYHQFYAGLLYKAWRFAEALKEAEAAV